ncbi:unnamed protein product [Chironomus riparius]|uniref:LITAF domain-containing protein n=1 Tax=Chironomus riparius TaxID=315576 RepID=A0A9N9RXJ1_9DIPT|nr:unnamed protein product [Chironomus riparius]
MEYKMFETSSKMSSFPAVNEEQPQNVQNPTIIIQNPAVATSIIVHQKFGRYSIVMTCPFCKTTIKTIVKKVHPFWDLICCLCCFGTWSCKEKNHICEHCGTYLGMCSNLNSDFEVTSQKINKMSKLLQNMPLPSLPSIHQNETAFSNPMPPSNNSIGMLPGNYGS